MRAAGVALVLALARASDVGAGDLATSGPVDMPDGRLCELRGVVRCPPDGWPSPTATPRPTASPRCSPGLVLDPPTCSVLPCVQTCRRPGWTPTPRPTATTTRTPAGVTSPGRPRIAGLDEVWRSCAATGDATTDRWAEAQNLPLSVVVARAGQKLPRCASTVWASIFPRTPESTTDADVARAERTIEAADRQVPRGYDGLLVHEHAFASWSYAAATGRPEPPDPLAYPWGGGEVEANIARTAAAIRRLCSTRRCLVQPYLGAWAPDGKGGATWADDGGWIDSPEFYRAAARWLDLLRAQYPTVEVSWQLSNCSFPGWPERRRRGAAVWLPALSAQRGLAPRVQIEACVDRDFGTPATPCSALSLAELWPGTLISVWPGQPEFLASVRLFEACPRP